MGKRSVPGSQQELYTVSVESVPQYAARSVQKSSGCCGGRRGPAGKDLLCGVLIALAVICAAVAIFLIVFYVVNSGENQAPTNETATDLLNGTHDSSPLTSRHREEEVPLNALGNGNFAWDGNKSGDPTDRLSLSSTPLPEVGIHEPEEHGHDVYQPYGNSKILSQPASSTSTTTEAPTTSTTTEPSTTTEATTTTTTETTTTSVKTTTAEPSTTTAAAVSSTATTTEVVLSDDVSPVVEVNSEEIAHKNDTSLFVPDDDVIIETLSSSPSTVDVSIRTEEPSSSEPSPVTPSAVAVETSGFVPVQTIDVDLETEAQTEAAPEILAKPNGAPVVDNTPWKPIAGQDPALPVAEPKLSTVATPTSSPIFDASSEPSPSSPLADEEAQEFDGSMHGLGNMAFLIPPEVRNRSSTLVKPVAGAVASSSSQCVKRNLDFCRGVLPYSETVLPNWVGDVNEVERNLSVPYFGIISESECHERIQQYACAVLEPPCRGNGISLPPCRQFCRAIAEDCKKFVLPALHINRAFECDQFPQSNDPNVCLNLASTTPEGECLDGEYRCSKDNTCIPERWLCDGEPDCSQGDDEASCSSVCRDEEFKCELENRCLPKRWRCDGSPDCSDGSDERDCPADRECGDGQFKCRDGLSCIPLRWVCDGTNHCRDNSDEANCTVVDCLSQDFKCRDNGVCIPRHWVCDQNIDCKDGSDELECPEAKRSGAVEPFPVPANETASDAFDAKCPVGELLCISDLSCIRFEQFCDGTKDCSDGADESDCVEEAEEETEDVE